MATTMPATKAPAVKKRSVMIPGNIAIFFFDSTRHDGKVAEGNRRPVSGVPRFTPSGALSRLETLGP
jgi:hypothetical protein